MIIFNIWECPKAPINLQTWCLNLTKRKDLDGFLDSESRIVGELWASSRCCNCSCQRKGFQVSKCYWSGANLLNLLVTKFLRKQWNWGELTALRTIPLNPLKNPHQASISGEIILSPGCPNIMVFSQGWPAISLRPVLWNPWIIATKVSPSIVNTITHQIFSVFFWSKNRSVTKKHE